MAHLEVEAAFDVPAGAPLPLTGLGPRVARATAPTTTVLEAVYWDDPAGTLLRAGVTLRRRTGGPDEGWHLKLPAGTTEGPRRRTEHHAPLGPPDAPPPPELLELVRPLLAPAGARPAAGPSGPALAPAAHVVTRRRAHDLLDAAGRPLVQLVDDDVTTWRPGAGTGPAWRQWEAELTGGDEDDLAAVTARLLTVPGVRPRTAGKLAGALGGGPPDDLRP